MNLRLLSMAGFILFIASFLFVLSITDSATIKTDLRPEVRSEKSQIITKPTVTQSHPTVVDSRTAQRLSNAEVLDPIETNQLSEVNEPLTTPVFYQIKPDRYASLDPSSTAALGYAIYQFSSFYNQWVNTYPHDISTWNEKVSEIQADLHTRLGGDGYDNLFRPAPPTNIIP